MTDWERSGLTCALQVAIVAGVTLLCLGRPGRASGADRLTLCQWSLLGLALLSGLAILRPLSQNWPDWSLLLTAPKAVVAQTADSSHVATLPGPAAVPEGEGLEIAWSDLFATGQRLWSLTGQYAARSVWPRWKLWVAIPVLLLVTVATIRLLLAALWLQRLWGTSRLVDDAELTTSLHDLQAAYGLRGRVLLRETTRLCQPAVIGWWRPVILLPCDWRDWNAEERRLVLAHELAHVRRGDVRWRLVAQAVLSLHVYQPLVHALQRRLILEQELAADRAAAALCGGSAAYLKTLSTLALRSDDRPERTTLAPVLTGLLMRRVEMLQTREGRTVAVNPWKNWLLRSGVVAAVVVACGLQLPAVAEGPGEETKADRERLPEQLFEIIPAGDDTRLQGDPAELFSRSISIPALQIGAGDGMAELRLGDILNGPVRRLLTMEQRDELIEGLFNSVDQLSPGQKFRVYPVHSLGEYGAYLLGSLVDTVSIDINLKLSHNPNAEPGHRHGLSVSTRAVAVGLTANQQWKAALLSSSEHSSTVNGVPYLHADDSEGERGRPADALELAPCYAFPDEKTVVAVFGEKELQRIFPVSPAALPAQMVRLRNAVGGGLATVVLPVDAEKLKGLFESDEPTVAAFAPLISKIELAAVGIDIGRDDTLAIRARGACKDMEQARSAEQTVRSLLQTARDYLTSPEITEASFNENGEPEEMIGILNEFLDRLTLKVEPQEDGTADLVLQTSSSTMLPVLLRK